MNREEEIEKWLRDEVGPAYDRLKAEPSRVMTIDEVNASLEAHIAKRKREPK